MSLYGSQFVVTWTANGKRHEKVYDEYAQAQKAVKWLVKQGVLDADLAIRLPVKEDADGVDKV